jgi:hypothetical protein
MKNTWKKIVVVLALLGASALSSARGAVSVYAEEVEPSSNAVAATAGANIETNVSATTTHRSHRTSADADDSSVRIDETGVHVGGANPVDIGTPDFAHRYGEAATGALQHLTGMLAVIGSFGLPVAMIAIIFYFKHRRNKMAHETLRTMIEKGVPMTPELVAEVRGQGCGSSGGGRTRSRLLPGLILTGTGIALLIGGSRGDGRAGWIVLFVGAAFLIVWLVEGKNQNNGQPPR